MKKNKLKKLALGLGTVGTIVAPIAAVVSCGSGTGENVFNQGRRTLIEYQGVDSFAGEDNRVWDMSVQSQTPNSRTVWDMSITTLFKQRVTQQSEVTVDNAGAETVKQGKVEEWTLDGAANVGISHDGGATFAYDGGDAKAAINEIENGDGVNTYKFTVPSGKHYIDSTGKETKYEYKAIDYLYGFLRNLYTTEEVREKGSIKGVATNAPKMEQAYQEKMKKDSEWYPEGKLDTANFENGNSYLLNLFGVDIKGTIDANTGANENDDQFILKMKNVDKNTAFISSILGSSNVFTPISSQKIRELNGMKSGDAFDEPGKYLQLLEFGKAKRTNGVADLSGELSVGKYYFTKYDTRADKNGGEGVIMVKNPFGVNEEYAKNDKTLLKFIQFVHGKTDEDTFAQARQRSFLADNSESILYGSVKERKPLMEKVKTPDYTKRFVSSKTGGLSQGLMNPYYMVNGTQKLDDNTSKLLFGENTADVDASTTADDEYFFGRGRQFRALLNTSMDLYSITAISTPSATSFKTARDYEAGQAITTGGDTFGDHPNQGVSINSISDQAGQDWYADHTKDTTEALKPGSEANFDRAKQGWKTFLSEARTELGLASSDKFTFPLYDYRASDGTETEAQVSSWKAMTDYLNKINEGNNITFVPFRKDAGDKETNIINKFKTAPFVYSGAGADYPSVASLIQQFISANYGFTIGAELLASSIDDQSATKDIDANYGLTGEVDLSDLWTFINGSSDAKILKEADAKTKLESITLQDWVDYRTASLSDDTKQALLDEIDNVFQKYFLSISGDQTKVDKWVQFISNANIGDKLAIGYPSYSAAATPITGDQKVPVAIVYAQPWIHLAEVPSSEEVQDNYVDLTIDPE